MTASQPGRKVLLVDDDEPTSRLIQLILGLEGYTVSVSQTREEALVVAQETSPDLVITDYLMRGLDAVSFLAQLREQGFSGPILLCTAFHDDLDLETDGVLRKPFDPNDLTKKVKALLEA